MEAKVGQLYTGIMPVRLVGLQTQKVNVCFQVFVRRSAAQGASAIDHSKESKHGFAVNIPKSRVEEQVLERPLP